MKKIILTIPFVFVSFWISAQALFLNMSVRDAKCSQPTGLLRVIVSGGNGTYTYQWSNGGILDSIANLAPGPYSVTVTSGASTATISDVVSPSNVPISLSISASPNDTVCSGTNVTLTGVAAGINGGTYTWTGGGISSPQTVNPYSETLTNTATFNLSYNYGTCSSSALITIEAKPVKAAIAGTVQPTCGLDNGSISGSGTAFISQFSWYKDGTAFGSNASILNKLGPGNYTFIVLDDVTKCSDTVSNIVLTDNTNFAKIDSLITTDETCFDKKDGTARLVVSGGTGTYKYAWSHSATVKTAAVSQLAQGTYYVTVDDGGCLPITDTLIISGPKDSLATDTATTQDYCNKGIGTATITATGGTPPYAYSWAMGFTNTTMLQLVAGSYPVTVTDQNGCTAATTAVVTGIAAPVVTFATADSLCPGFDNGTLTAIASGAASSYTYSWSHDPALQKATAQNLAAGLYDVTISDIGGCTASASIYLAEFDHPTIDAGNDTSIYSGGIATLVVATNLPVNKVQWSPYIASSANSLIAYAAPADTTKYRVVVGYGRGCVLTDSVTVNVIDSDATINVPNVFTPNGDGINDFFYITSTGVKAMKIYVFDRWGNKVLETTDPAFRWDGNDAVANGEPLGTAVFTYMIEYVSYKKENEKRIVEGSVTIVR
jgi:gliding motility-associated-like protein